MGFPGLPQLSTLRNSRIPWALVVSAFVNKCGDLAMSLLPMLLIERQISTGNSSLILGATKSAQMAGLFLSGLLCDAVGFRFVILSSYFLCIVGFSALPFLFRELWIALFAIIAQFGIALFNPAARSMVKEIKGLAVKTSTAWLRAASNCGQVIASLIGIAVGPLGLLVPFVVDALTSLVAFSISLFTLKNPPATAEKPERGRVEKGYYQYALATGALFFIYELGWLSFAGYSKLALGDQAVRAYGVALFVNTLLCGLLAVPCASYFQRPALSLSLGAILTASGLVLMVLLPKSIPCFALSSLIMTAGELAFSVHVQTLLLVNSSGRSSKHYGLAMMIQASGRLLAGVAVFPLVLRSTHPEIPFLAAVLFFFALLAFLPRAFLKRGEAA